MAHSLLSAFRRLVLTAVFRVVPEPRANINSDLPPEPIRRRLTEGCETDALLFDVSRTEVDDQVGMLSGEMDRLSGSVDGLREMLGRVAEHAPRHAEVPAPTFAAALHEDAMLFDGEPAFVGESGVALGDVEELFEEELPADRVAQAA